MCPQFRVLIIGKANAGKTTILEKMCNVKAGTRPTIYDENGKKLSSSLFKKASRACGEHNIEHQITYSGSSFVFHDSLGFEAGSQDEIEKVKSFISKCSNHTNMKDQLHVICTVCL
ncbi:hypothetical protein AcW1_003908 [Taiwanofungus camphoratus]|nr:hypothetical protein AcW1_003908 [Antrodia cinnamomea]